MAWRSGLPINIRSGIDFVGNQRGFAQRPDRVDGVDPYVQDANDRLLYVNKAAFDVSAPSAERRFGDLGYNTLRGPSAFTWDAALHKTFALQEGHRITFRIEAFNVLNHPVFGNPNNVYTNPNFGRILTASDGRSIQLGVKYLF